ncbi:MAG: epimerase [Cyanobacteria bacterium QS_3_48_167]|nr:MAG: epimerase [Cyanobacteria bacterium QS_3_48_167]
MIMKRIFITGASGCIGHYLAETLIQETEHELFLLVRNPDKLKFDYKARPGINILPGDLREIDRFRDLLKTIDVAILAAAAWGGTDVYEVNAIQTTRLTNLLDPNVCQQVIYFSTASIIDYHHNLLPQAEEMGTDYISSKYQCYQNLQKSAIAPRLTVLFPTLVLGGETNKPYSHVFSDLPGAVKWVNLLRWFKIDGSFHFIHARDIAQVVRHLVDSETSQLIPNSFVLGNRRVTANELIETFCAYLGKRIYFRLPLPLWLANFFIAIFGIQMARWDRFCLNYRHFTHQNPVNPASFGLPTYCSTLSDVLKISGIPPKGRAVKQQLGNR